MSTDLSFRICFNYTGRDNTQKSEINSWVNSLQYMDRVLNDPAIPGDAGVAIEYHIPKSNKRIDFILTGADAGSLETAILVELKQWQHAALTDKDSIVITEFMGQPRETTPPSYQVWSSVGGKTHTLFAIDKCTRIVYTIV